MFITTRILTLFKGFIFIFIFTQLLNAQPQIDLPNDIKIEINDSELLLTSGWIDSLNDVAITGMIHYKILGAIRSEYYITTQIQIPQILSLDDVLRQIILYYALLPNEDAREREILKIFPFFESTAGDPALKALYKSKDDYDIDVFRWNQVPIPASPIPEDREIFNQILQTSFKGVQSFGEVPANVFEKVATKNSLTVDRVRIIYQNTILWQVGNQMRLE